ncbi:MAG: ABC transporter permease subunit, partial [Desulforhabdus sp.]|nr:ABC transporter permease subunit [Desulforhabdus sp.]
MAKKTQAPHTYWQMVWHHFKKRHLAVAGLGVTLFLFSVAILAPLLANDRPIAVRYAGNWYWPLLSAIEKVGPYEWSELKKKKPGIFQTNIGEPGDLAIWPLVPYSATEYNLLESLTPPSGKHWFGTDDRGRDVLSRMIYGARISLSVGFVAVGIAVFIGVFLGALAGYFGGWADHLISRLIEILITIPTFFLIIAIIAFLPPSIYNIMVVIGLTGWTGVARFVRAEFFKLKRLDFVLASRALGASHSRLILIHM